MSKQVEPEVGAEERFDPEEGLVYLRGGGKRDEPLSLTVVKAVAAATNRDPTNIEPLYDAINPDALNQIYEPKANGGRRKPGGTVTFWLEQCEITVHQNGDIVIGIPDDVLARTDSETDGD